MTSYQFNSLTPLTQKLSVKYIYIIFYKLKITPNISLIIYVIYTFFLIILFFYTTKTKCSILWPATILGKSITVGFFDHGCVIEQSECIQFPNRLDEIEFNKVKN